MYVKLFFTSVICFFVSCGKGPAPAKSYDEKNGVISSIHAPETGNIGQKLKIDVVYGGQDGCSEQGHIEITTIGYQITVKAFYHQPKSQNACTMLFPYFNGFFEFTPDKSGTFIIKSESDPIVTDTILVN